MNMQASSTTRIHLILVPLLFIVAGCSQSPRIPLDEVKEFGSNPGELRMLKYLPGSLEPGRTVGTALDSNGHEETQGAEISTSPRMPLVIALHGCMQDAAEYGEHSGWIQLADRWRFLLLLPEQRRGNNLLRCFNWYSPQDHRRGAGEAASIHQMIDRMSHDHAVDPQRIYVTGISAGAAMTLALLAQYPEIFAGAAPVAGIPFGCADGLFSGLSCMRAPPKKKAADWGAAVRAATNHKGPWPRISVWQGESDAAVEPANAAAIVSQWTDVHGIDRTPEQMDNLEGHIHSLFRDSEQRPLVESYLIKGMVHGVPVDPGPGENQCGKAGRFFPDMDICSGLYIAQFWGLQEHIGQH